MLVLDLINYIFNIVNILAVLPGRIKDREFSAFSYRSLYFHCLAHALMRDVHHIVNVMLKASSWKRHIKTYTYLSSRFDSKSFLYLALGSLIDCYILSSTVKKLALNPLCLYHLAHRPRTTPAVRKLALNPHDPLDQSTSAINKRAFNPL